MDDLGRATIMLLNSFAIAIGGACGALGRWLISETITKWLGPLGWGTLCVNSLGCFLLGWLSLWRPTFISPTLWQHSVLIGGLGAFTTFSTFSKDVFTLWQHHWLLGISYILASNSLGIAGFCLARLLASK